MQFLTIWDIVLWPFYLLVIYYFARRVRDKRIEKNPEYQYYIAGLFAKIAGGIGVCLIYAFYYVGGDTIGYSEGSSYLSRVLTTDPPCWLSIMFDNRTPENRLCFSYELTGGTPMYWWDHCSFSVIRFTNLLSLLGFRSFILTTILIAVLTYPGVWRLFLLFYHEFPHQKKAIALSILFVPSVCFWGSAILKDSYTLSASCWLIYAFYYLFLKQKLSEMEPKRIIYYIGVIFISIFVLLSLKPYIFLAVFIGLLLMITHRGFKRFESSFLRGLFFPLMIITIWGGGLFTLNQVRDELGSNYSSLDGMLEKAVLTQQDLISSERYGKNFFDIGEFDATLGGVLGKAPKAMIAGLFRPYLWECNNPVMFISGVENFFLLFASFYVIVLSIVAMFKRGIRYMVSTTFDHSLIVFSIIFSITFAFFIGLTTANFGALVRYKIPLIPFLLASMFSIINRYNISKAEYLSK